MSFCKIGWLWIGLAMFLGLGVRSLGALLELLLEDLGVLLELALENLA